MSKLIANLTLHISKAITIAASTTTIRILATTIIPAKTPTTKTIEKMISSVIIGELFSDADWVSSHMEKIIRNGAIIKRDSKAHRELDDSLRKGHDDKKEYLVKWKELPYDECYWELKSDISAFQTEIERFNTFKSRSRKLLSSKKKRSVEDDAELNKQQKEFLQYEHSLQFLSGGALHSYQLEGLNFLRFSWSKQTHVILADEMGLGKTIQSIAFLASLFEENVSPHLVVAPLSTLRNWEREFATWAPQMNVVMYFGSAKARAFIREYEFYFPKNQKRIKKKKSRQIVNESKQERIKFDVLLTSYEIINSDTSSLKHIKWECMIVDEGHRLKNKDSKLFSSLKQYSSKHRVLLTGTPLQNNLDELFMLMHFLDAGKFGSLEEFQEEFKDINREEQILRLHKMIGAYPQHLLYSIDSID
ncbi:CHD3-type chromatin-remodeling factor PICKLE [Glycine soja]|uniref:CHD3-type chromatin-remodeling factor PICKLE n=1 Tax=Glycine soja TaxID=3848 RepID=A0A0B2SN46_GLYSO|nr:CHD3-type chromatin-remodeling factor PICKLE [Glycine soja]